MALVAPEPGTCLTFFMPPTEKPRILAIDLRPQRFGYAVSEGPKKLLDWGAANYRPGGDVGAASARTSAGKLIAIFHPVVIVARKARGKTMAKSRGVQPILKALRHLARTHDVPVHLVSRADVRVAFRPHGAKTKHEIACSLAALIPELRWRLPPQREIYESEPSAMTIFDAVALGYTYWQAQAPQTSAREAAPPSPFAGPAGDV